MRVDKRKTKGLWQDCENYSDNEFLEYIKKKYYTIFGVKLPYKTLSTWTRIKPKTLEAYFSNGKHKRNLPWIVRRLMYLEILRYNKNYQQWLQTQKSKTKKPKTKRNVFI